jgi:hypothetical protein
MNELSVELASDRRKTLLHLGSGDSFVPWLKRLLRGVSLYGMGRFPVTLYKEQWLRILTSAPEIEAFIAKTTQAENEGIGF